MVERWGSSIIPFDQNWTAYDNREMEIRFWRKKFPANTTWGVLCLRAFKTAKEAMLLVIMSNKARAMSALCAVDRASALLSLPKLAAT